MSTNDYVTIIAEAGVNHNGDLTRARSLIEAAAEAGADVVKFQTFTADAIALRTAPKANYQLRTVPEGESQHEMLRALEISADDHLILRDHAIECGIDFLSTPFDRPSLTFLTEELGLRRVKISSSDLTNIPLLVDAGRSGASIIVSTGMSTLAEVEMALKAICYGLASDDDPNTTAAFDDVYADSGARQQLAASVVLLHCTSEYPTAPGQVNLRAMGTLWTAFDLPVGYSDHTQGQAVAVAAVARGAVILEKHLTLDRNLPGPDHAASSEPSEFAQLVQSVREVQAALGSQIKAPTPSELPNRAPMRKGMYAARDITAGSIVSADDIRVVRPETPVGPDSYFDWLGSIAPRGISAGEPLG